MDIMSGLAAASQALDIAKKLREFEKSFNEAEFKLQIAELYTALSDVKMALADAKETIQSKDAEIRRLKEVEASKARTVFYNGYNFGITPDGQLMGLPFCPTCEKTSGQQFQIVNLTSDYYRCPSCQTLINDPPTRLPAHLMPKD